MTEVLFPDGTLVRGASLFDRDQNATWRRYGLYLDARWNPSWPAEIVSWPDYDTPTDFEQTAEAIERAFARARAGENVEVGCAGGVGRTGTVLACMAVLASIPPERAVAWIREIYHPAAVETVEQEQWVEWFATWASCDGA